MTLSTAQSSGWVWDIGLTSRRGVGYVFSSSHVSDDGALEELKDYLSAEAIRRGIELSQHRHQFRATARNSGSAIAWRWVFRRGFSSRSRHRPLS